MSITERMEKHQEDIARESQNVQELMLKSDSGNALMEASSEMAMSEEMQGLMGTIDNPSASDQDKFLMGKYMGQMLQDDPEQGLVNYSNYLLDVANNPDYADRKDYFSAISDAALKLNASPSFKNYVEKYKMFEQDDSPEATATRNAMESMSAKMREWMEGEE